MFLPFTFQRPRKTYGHKQNDEKKRFLALSLKERVFSKCVKFTLFIFYLK